MNSLAPPPAVATSTSGGPTVPTEPSSTIAASELIVAMNSLAPPPAVATSTSGGPTVPTEPSSTIAASELTVATTSVALSQATAPPAINIEDLLHHCLTKSSGGYYFLADNTIHKHDEYKNYKVLYQVLIYNSLFFSSHPSHSFSINFLSLTYHNIS